MASIAATPKSKSSQTGDKPANRIASQQPPKIPQTSATFTRTVERPLGAGLVCTVLIGLLVRLRHYLVDNRTYLLLHGIDRVWDHVALFFRRVVDRDARAHFLLQLFDRLRRW